MDENPYKAPLGGLLPERKTPSEKDLKAYADLVNAADTWVSWIVVAIIVIVAIGWRCLAR